jgi:hypothetical protein
MKLKLVALLTMVLLVFNNTSHAQSIVCGAFSVTAVTPDSVDPTTYYISIESVTAPSFLVNYPYVAAVLDCNADTVATGGLIYFGQAGQTTLDYPVTISGSLSCQPLTFVFVYGIDPGLIDTCLLTFGTTDVIAPSVTEKRFSVYPNPASVYFTLEVSTAEIGQPYYLYDAVGKMVGDGVIESTSTRILVAPLPQGIYSARIGRTSHKSFLVIKE